MVNPLSNKCEAMFKLQDHQKNNKRKKIKRKHLSKIVFYCQDIKYTEEKILWQTSRETYKVTNKCNPS
jgi:hypothetical protein